jgi:RNA polymerase sigma-70 factor (ECF subfamily)
VPVEDPSDFSVFFAAHYPRLVGQLYAVTGELHDAEGAVQEAFVRASVRWERIRRYEVPELWVRRVVLHLTIDRRRATRRRLTRLISVTPAPIEPQLSDDAVALAAALRTLPLIQRQVLVLHHGLCLTVGEIARELGVPVGTVKSRLLRGRQALARQLDPPPEEAGDHG